MRSLFIILFTLHCMQDSVIIIKFNDTLNSSNWKVVDDVVMGGRSDGNFKINKEGQGEFSGRVSLENNGGFSSVRIGIKPLNVEKYKGVHLRVKGDNKRYQFRIKDQRRHRYSYIFKFETSGDWETIFIPFDKMIASFRGYQLDIPNYSGDIIEEITFLIGNKRAEDFRLLLDTISLVPK